MTRTKTKAPPSAEPVSDVPDPVPQVCATCRHWRPRPNWRPIGECMPSRNGMAQPLVTTDWQSCSAHQYSDEYGGGQ